MQSLEKIPAVLHFCCGCSLRTGTLLILTFELIVATLCTVYGTLIAISEDAPAAFTLIFFLIFGSLPCIHAAGIYGVLKKRPSYLKPYLGYLAGNNVMVILCMVVIAVIGAVWIVHPLATPSTTSTSSFYTSGYSNWDTNNQVVRTVHGVLLKFFIASSFIAAEISLFFIEAIYFYLFAVVLSFYKQLVERNQRRNDLTLNQP